MGRGSEHVELSLTEILQRLDKEIGRATDEVAGGTPGAEGHLALAGRRHAEVLTRRERLHEELERQRAVTLQGVERLVSTLVLPQHPESNGTDSGLKVLDLVPIHASGIQTLCGRITCALKAEALLDESVGPAISTGTGRPHSGTRAPRRFGTYDRTSSTDR